MPRAERPCKTRWCPFHATNFTRKSLAPHFLHAPCVRHAVQELLARSQAMATCFRSMRNQYLTLHPTFRHSPCF